MSQPTPRQIRQRVAVERIQAAADATQVPGTNRPIKSGDSAGILVESPFASMLGLHDDDTEVKTWIDANEGLVVAKVGEDVEDFQFDLEDVVEGGDRRGGE